jgi:16S rRNA (adenine1518-N6/adenine1519-N6)-dimethyltransferase
MSGPSLSQVILTDSRWKQRIVAAVPEAEFGVEWAPGRGALTELLLDRWRYMVAMELDHDFCRTLRDKVSTGNIGVIRTNILRYPLPEERDKFPLVGNLPYHLTGPLLVKICREAEKITEFHGLVQKEVGERIVANPGDSEFRSISVLMQWSFEVELVADVPASAFTPEPEVDSAWIQLFPRDRTRPFEAVRQFIEICFQQPRKTLVNNLSSTSEEKQFWKEWFEDKNWDSRRRPHSLNVNQFLEVFDTWNNEL